MEAEYAITVADMVTKNIKTADVFKRHGIDFCCGGGVSIAEACTKHNVDLASMEQELENILVESKESLAYNEMPLDELIQHVLDKHHTYVNDAIPLILEYSNKVAKVHGSHYKEQIEINELFKKSAADLYAHMKKEEQVLFPYIAELLNVEKNAAKFNRPSFQNIERPISVMNEEHESAGEDFRRIRELANDYKPPLDACNTFRALYAKLEEFEEDLHLHVHLENNLIFPKAKVLEKKLMDQR